MSLPFLVVAVADVVDDHVVEDGDGVVGALLEAGVPKTNLDTRSLEKRLCGLVYLQLSDTNSTRLLPKLVRSMFQQHGSKGLCLPAFDTKTRKLSLAKKEDFFLHS